MADVVRVGVIGTGIGVAHVQALQEVPGAAVAAICSAQGARAEEVAGRFGVPRATDDYRDLLGPGIDAVVIATPPALHARMGLDAIAAGKHVLCEKPLAASLAEARALRDAVHRAGVIHVVNFQLRFAAPYARAAELARGGYLGRLAVADARISINPVDYLRGPDWSPSKAAWFTDAAQAGGLLVGSAGPHLVDLLAWLGGRVEAVAARTAVTRPVVGPGDGGAAREVSAADAFLGLLRYAGGGLATIRGVPVAYHGGGFALELNGTEGTLVVEGGALRGATAADEAPADIPLPSGAPRDRVAIAARFVEAIRAGGPAPAPNFEEGVAAQAVLDALAEAARTGRWVAVGEG